MDENKELLTEENEVETTPDTDTNTTDSETPVPDVAVAAEEAVAETAPAPKKKKALQFTIIISLAIVLCVLAAAIVCRVFFQKSVVNYNLIGAKTTTTWHYRFDTSTLDATVDEAQVPDYYFVFEPDGSVKVEVGSIEYQGTYTLRNLEEGEAGGNENIAADAPVLQVEGTSQIDGVFAYERSGNAFSGSKLKLLSTTNAEVSVQLDSKEYIPATLEREGDFTGDDALTGSWTYKNEIGQWTFLFKDDGSYESETTTSSSIQREKGLYNCKNGTLTRMFKYANVQQQDELKYTVKDNKLTFVMQSVDYFGQVTEQTIEFTKDE